MKMFRESIYMKKFLSFLLTVILVFSIAAYPASAGSSDEGVGDFVTRLYSICLNRRPDQNGYSDWTSKLIRNEITGSEAAYGFIFSPEFQNLDVTNNLNGCQVMRPGRLITRSS